MSVYAVIGFTGSKKNNTNTMTLVDSFLVLDLATSEKFYVDKNFLEENRLNFCLSGDTDGVDWFYKITSCKNEDIYFDNSTFYFYNKTTNSLSYLFDIKNNGICFIDDTLLVSKDEYILYTTMVVDHFGIAYFPYSGLIELVYIYRGFGIFDDNSYFCIRDNRKLDKKKAVIILYSYHVSCLLPYKFATCENEVYNIGGMYWTDEFYISNGGTFLIPNGCIAFYIIGSSFCFDTIVFPPTIRFIEYRIELTNVKLNKCYIKKSKNASLIVKQIRKLLGHSNFAVEYY
jgi:hypothetical protein